MGGLEMKASMERTLVAAIAGSAIGQEKICDRLAICKFCELLTLPSICCSDRVLTGKQPQPANMVVMVPSVLAGT
jgi:hypothetical protein